MSDPSAHAATISAVVLLDTEPRGVGAYLSRISPQLQTRVDQVPQLAELAALGLTINGSDVVVRTEQTPLQHDRLSAAVRQSPVRQLVEPAVAGHRGRVEVTISEITDPHSAQHTLSGVTAAIAGGADAVAVYLPHQSRATTQVLYVGEAVQRPAQTWFWAPAMWLDQQQGTAHAFTEGLAVLGGLEVQYSNVPVEPAQAFRTLRSIVAEVLEAGSVPRTGLGVDIDGVPHQFVLGTDVIRRIPVLDLVPAPASP
ncbi:MAG TPA: hypothetical protein H9815_02130 [Candidatus Ruania gallistercoris]|uniref:DUF4261 domain-containing protein n=1 Tax=Candidatus Ruania gallistercoris TaxID=2838746 RepID=A0A9D2EBU8_9MICO|nr:hypothetical protein [Candidatus Ruania gallistercoris]